MNVKYQIFVSSTYEDLKDERNEVIKACLNMGHIPVGMEMFNAADEEQWAVITPHDRPVRLLRRDRRPPLRLDHG
jgi:Domain of unknown function (DUF4062)